MSREEILSLLDTPAGQSDLEVAAAETCDTVSPVEVSETALALDDWSLRRGREVLENSELLQKQFGMDDPASLDASKSMDQCVEEFQKLTADFHGAAFEPEPQLAPACANERLRGYMQQLLETPEFKALHQETQLDEAASELAAAAFAQSWVALAKTEQSEDDFKSQMQAMRAASQALQSACGEVSDLRDAQSALGLGGNGGGNGTLPAAELAKMFKRVQGSQQLKRICELAGRYRRFAQAQQRKKVLHGRDDVVGVVLDGDVGRLLPHELVALGDPDLELDVMRRLVERQAMCRDYRGIESKARGPIVVVVDESGSMGGEPIATAKAMALALIWVARHQKRWCCLVGFSGGTEGTYCVVQPGRDNPEPLMEWLEHFYGGGTTVDVPLVELPAKWGELGCPKGKTDILCITDAIVSVPAAVRQSFLAWKAQEQVKLVTLIINGEPGDMAGVSDRVHRVKSLSLEESSVAEALTV